MLIYSHIPCIVLTTALVFLTAQHNISTYFATEYFLFFWFPINFYIAQFSTVDVAHDAFFRVFLKWRYCFFFPKKLIICQRFNNKNIFVANQKPIYGN